jgi:hypothetical protein
LQRKIKAIMVFSGNLNKMGSFVPNWKARFFTLDSIRLTYFESEYGKQKGQFIITSDTEVAVAGSMMRDNVFVVKNPERTLYLSATSMEELDAWMTALENSIEQANGRI